MTDAPRPTRLKKILIAAGLGIGLGAVCGIVAALARVPPSAIGPATGAVAIALAIIYRIRSKTTAGGRTGT